MKIYAKFIVQVFFVALSALSAALLDDSVDAAEWMNVIIAALGAVAVLGAGELPHGVWSKMKTWVAAATAAATLLVAFVSDGWYVTTTEWIQVALTAAAALGVAVAPGPKVYDAGDLGRAASGLSQGPV